jgi:hypothetical protein
MTTLRDEFVRVFLKLDRAASYLKCAVAQNLLTSLPAQSILEDAPALLQKAWDGHRHFSDEDWMTIMPPGRSDANLLPSFDEDRSKHIEFENGYVALMEVTSVRRRITTLCEEAHTLLGVINEAVGEVRRRG